MAYEIILEPRGVLKKLSGFVSSEEYQRSVELIQDSAIFDDLHYVIVDCSAITDDDFTNESLRDIALMRHVAFRSNPACIIAFVVTSVRLARLIVHAVFPVRKAMKICVVTSLEEARSWLKEQRA